MATPSYKGSQHVPVRASWLGSWLNATPAYVGAGQPAAATSMFGSSSPAYKPASTTPAIADTQQVTSDDSDACGPTAFAIVVPRQ